MAKVGSKIAAKKKVERAEPGLKDYAVLQSPVITEKSSLAGSESNTVVFRVDRRATKDDIRSAVQKIYKVEVKAVRTCNYMGKVKRTKGAQGRRAAFKKAYVSLKEGQTIDVVEGL
ncbi:MAG: 50S ribosomal protein L23 [Oligoflexia bacterium]|nr:50S ribosomal protein L23 [Oligoflexia bacterium]